MTTLILLLAAWIHAKMDAQWFSHPLLLPIHEYKAVYSRDLGAIASFLIILAVLYSFKALCQKKKSGILEGNLSAVILRNAVFSSLLV